MTDYDDVRTCCSGASLCEKCWMFMVMAVKVVNRTLREDFGFNSLLWVFSGRRGIHCWVCDPEAIELSNEGRTAIADYMSLYVGNELTGGSVSLSSPLHPSLSRAADILIPYFKDIMVTNQRILQEPLQAKKILDMVKNKAVRDNIQSRWEDESEHKGSDEMKWDILVKEIERHNRKQTDKKFNPDLWLEEIVFTFLYPRLDANVSKGMNHLLKSPWCVHPKTGKICVPFNPDNVVEFDPNECPTLKNVLKERDEELTKGKANPVLESLKPAFKVMH